MHGLENPMKKMTRLIACRCGAAAPKSEAGVLGWERSTLLECRTCGRIVGGLSNAEARAMWNASNAPARPLWNREVSRK